MKVRVKVASITSPPPNLLTDVEEATQQSSTTCGGSAHTASCTDAIAPRSPPTHTYQPNTSPLPQAEARRRSFPTRISHLLEIRPSKRPKER